jgi:hypothetical protein
MRLFSVLGAYGLVANNDAIHYSMFAILMYFKHSKDGHISDDDFIELTASSNIDSEQHMECFEAFES